MADEEQDNGISGVAGLALGRMWANHDRMVDETYDQLHARRGPNTADRRVSIAEVNALRLENAQLRQQLADTLFDLDTYKMNYDELRRWADGAEETMRKLGVLKPRR